MVKTMVFLGYKDGQTPEQFETEYLGARADEICAVPGIARYAANILRDPTPEMIDAGWGWGAQEDTGIQAIDEIWVDDGIDVLALYEGQNVILACEVDQNNVFQCLEPVVERGQKSPWIKRLGLLRRKTGMTTEEFREYWANVHGPKATRIHRGASQYEQNRFDKVLFKKEGLGHWDGSMSLYYFCIDAFRYAHFSYEGAQKDIAEDCANFQDKFLALPYGEEYVMKR